MGGQGAGAVGRRVTVAVLTHNRRAEVLRTLSRLAALPERPPIVVVDNASTDGTGAAIVREFPGVTVVALDRNRGAAGRNAGVKAAGTPYVALSDDDTWWAPGALARASALFDAHPRLAVVSSHVLVGPDERPDPACHMMARSPLPRDPSLPGIPVLGFLAGASVVRREAFLEVGGFESRFFLGGEESLLAVDLVTRGWGLAYVADVHAHHHPSPHRDVPSRRRLLARNALWFTWLRRPWGRALAHTMTMVVARPRDRAVFLGAFDALRGLPWVLAHRRVVPGPVERGLRLVEGSANR